MPVNWRNPWGRNPDDPPEEEPTPLTDEEIAEVGDRVREAVSRGRDYIDGGIMATDPMQGEQGEGGGGSDAVRRTLERMRAGWRDITRRQQLDMEMRMAAQQQNQPTRNNPLGLPRVTHSPRDRRSYENDPRDYLSPGQRELMRRQAQIDQGATTEAITGPMGVAQEPAQPQGPPFITAPPFTPLLYGRPGQGRTYGIRSDQTEHGSISYDEEGASENPIVTYESGRSHAGEYARVRPPRKGCDHRFTKFKKKSKQFNGQVWYECTKCNGWRLIPLEDELIAGD